MTPDEFNAIKGRLIALGSGHGYQRRISRDVFEYHAESDIEALLNEVERLQNMLQNARVMLPVDKEADSRGIK